MDTEKWLKELLVKLNMEVVAKSDFARITPRKLRQVADEIRGLMAKDGLVILENLGKSAAGPLLLTLKQAVANAVNNFKLTPERLVIKEVVIDEGPTYKRGQAVSRGRWHSIFKRTSHIRIVLSGAGGEGGKNGTKS